MSTAGVAGTDDVWAYVEAFAARGVRRVHVQAHLRRLGPVGVLVVAGQRVGPPAPGRATIPSGSGARWSAALPWGPKIRRIGEVQVCHYYEPTPEWELAHRLARSSNLLSDGRVYASLEDRTSLLYRLGSPPTTTANRSSTPVRWPAPSRPPT